MADLVPHLVVVDPADASGFGPVTRLRPVASLRVGPRTLLGELLRRLQPSRVSLRVRSDIAPAARRLLADEGVAGDVNPANLRGRAVVVDSRWWLPPDTHPGESDAAGEVPAAPAGVRVAAGWWDLPDLVPLTLHETPSGPAPTLPPGVWTAGTHRLVVGPRATLLPGTVFDTRAGPVVLGGGVTVGPGAVVTGPACVGNGSVVLPGARIGPGAAVGPVCKVGGEVGAAIFDGYANKAHDGFVGHSYVGRWANLGAGTTTGNLKHTYGPVRAWTPRGRVDTGRTFVGSVIGDYARLGIGTMLSAGASVGVASQVAVARPPGFVDDFQFLTDAGQEGADVDKLVQTARLAAGRRGMTFGPDEEAAFRDLHARATSTPSPGNGGA